MTVPIVPVVLVGGGIVVLILCIYVLPRTIERSRMSKDLEKGQDIANLSVKDRYQLAHDYRKLQNDIRTALLQGFVGGALLAGLLFTWQQQRGVNEQLSVAQQNARTSEQGLVTERFREGVNELAAPGDYVQAGGIYTLVRVAKESPSDTATAAYTVILSFVRDNLCRNQNSPASLKGKVDFVGPPQSVVSGLQALRDNKQKIDLRHLRGCQGNLGTDLVNVDLSTADLTDAHFSGATLEGAKLVRADLHCANLHTTNFAHGANFTRANLSGADISNDDLKAAKGLTKDQLLQAYWDRKLQPGEHLPTVSRSLQGLIDRGPSKEAVDAYRACQRSPNA
jgi:Pentapeptide repeats (8 copies)